jgi:capsule polysaccharide export protein KpsE/RkpR
VESLRQENIHEVEVDFPSTPLGPVALPGSTAPDVLASLQLLWERRGLLLRVAIWALVVSTAIAFLIPRKYDSTVSIMPPDSLNNEGLMMAALAGKATPGLASMAGNLLGMKSTGALFVSLVRSRTVQDHIVERFDLQKVYWEGYKQDARMILSERTDVGEDRKSGVITLTVRDRNPQRAHDIAQAYVEELNRLVSQVSTSSARRERIFIEQRLAAVRADLGDAEREFSQFASKNTALDIKEQTKAMVESAALLQGQLIAAQSELQSLEQIYTGNNVRVRAARARIEELKRQLQKLGGTDASLASDASQSDQLYPSIRKLPLLGVQWADLYRRMKIQETVYELLNQQYELARIQEAKEIPTVNVVDQPNVPEKKSFPPRLVIIALLTLLALLGAAGCIIGAARWESVDAADRRKVFALNMWKAASEEGDKLRARLHRNGSSGANGRTSGDGQA